MTLTVTADATPARRGRRVPREKIDMMSKLGLSRTTKIIIPGAKHWTSNFRANAAVSLAFVEVQKHSDARAHW